MKNYIRMFSLFLLLYSHLSNAQSDKSITVIVQKAIASDIVDTVTIGHIASLNLNEYKGTQLVYSYSKPARFVVKATNPIEMVSIQIRGQYFPLAYVMPGDSVTLTITGKSNTGVLSGKSKNTFQLAKELDSVQKWGSFVILQSEKPSPINLKTSYYKNELIRDEQLLFLDRYQGKIPQEFYNLYKSDIIGGYIKNTASRTATMLQKGNFGSTLYPVIEQWLKSSSDTIKNNTLPYSASFVAGAREQIKLKQFLLDKKDSDMMQFYTTLKNELNGRLQEKAIFQFLKDIPRGTPDDFKMCTDDALSLLKNKEEIKALEKLLKQRGLGNRAYNFELINPAGKTVRLADYKGKTVLLDFWFTGCPGCLALSTMMEKDVLPQYSQNKDFVYISINADKNKKEWIGSIAGGKYTKENYVNLNTNGLGFNSPAITNFGVDSYPTLILIDKNGYIVNSNFVRDSAEIIENINKALSKKQ